MYDPDIIIEFFEIFDDACRQGKIELIIELITNRMEEIMVDPNLEPDVFKIYNSVYNMEFIVEQIDSRYSSNQEGFDKILDVLTNKILNDKKYQVDKCYIYRLFNLAIERSKIEYIKKFVEFIDLSDDDYVEYANRYLDLNKNKDNELYKTQLEIVELIKKYQK